MTTPYVRIDDTDIANGKRLGRITLANPKALNALRLDMIEPIQTALDRWDADPNVVCIFIDAEGDRAFCAGGDIVGLYRSITGEADPDYAAEFFTREYRMCHTLHRLATPCITWGDGVVMGGGLGLFAGATHRVVTETSRLAMPEIRIGLFPDCAAGWLFNRMPTAQGLFVALTGATLGAADALWSGLATHALVRDSKTAVLEALAAANDWQQPRARVSRVLAAADAAPDTTPDHAQLLRHAGTIQTVTAGATLADIAAAIGTLADDGDPWLAGAADNLAGGCPATAHLIHRQLVGEGRYLSLRQTVLRDLKMALQCCRHPDFAEGVRALLVDKDKTPRWHFDSVAEVPTDYVDAHFQASWNGGHPLHDLPEIEP